MMNLCSKTHKCRVEAVLHGGVGRNPSTGPKETFQYIEGIVVFVKDGRTSICPCPKHTRLPLILQLNVKCCHENGRQIPSDSN